MQLINIFLTIFLKRFDSRRKNSSDSILSINVQIWFNNIYILSLLPYMEDLVLASNVTETVWAIFALPRKNNSDLEKYLAISFNNIQSPVLSLICYQNQKICKRKKNYIYMLNIIVTSKRQPSAWKELIFPTLFLRVKKARNSCHSGDEYKLPAF